MHYHAATFHSVSFSKPNPVWFEFESSGHKCTTETPEQCKDVHRKVCHDQHTERCSTEYSFNDFSKPNLIWFGIFRTLTIVIKIFQTNLNLVWNLRLAKSFFSFQTKHSKFVADLQGCIPHGWRHTVEHLEDFHSLLIIR